MFLKLFVETYSSDNIFPEMYTSNVIRKSDLMYAFINKILNDKNEQHSSESDPEYIKRKFALERYLPAVAYEMMLMHKYSINNEVLKYLRSMVFNSNYFERFENEDEVISEKITSLKEINNICIKEFSLLNKSNDNYAFSHQVWQDFFCGKFYALCIKYDILEPFENAMPESVKQFIGEIIGECDFEEKDNLKNWTESPIEHFMQQHNMNSGNPISPIDTSNLIDIMKTCRNKKITACYDSLDLKYVNISRCDLRNSTFNYAKIYRFNFLAQGHRDLIISVAISPNGKKIVSGGADKTIRIWDARTGIQIGEPLTGHTDSVSSVAISPNGKKIVSGGRDGTIHIWDAETG